jgi:hypothetical protein
MTLRNLLATGQLGEHETDATQVMQVLASVLTALEDARNEAISLESRFDIAYRAIMQCSMVALWVNGYRPSSRSPGHHRTMIQTLTVSIGLPREHMLLLDAFRVKRNAIDYTGAAVDGVSVESCVEAAERLFRRLIEWIQKHRADLV